MYKTSVCQWHIPTSETWCPVTVMAHIAMSTATRNPMMTGRMMMLPVPLDGSAGPLENLLATCSCVALKRSPPTSTTTMYTGGWRFPNNIWLTIVYYHLSQSGSEFCCPNNNQLNQEKSELALQNTSYFFVLKDLILSR